MKKYLTMILLVFSLGAFAAAEKVQLGESLSKGSDKGCKFDRKVKEYIAQVKKDKKDGTQSAKVLDVFKK